jgi:hypothetical protein
MLGGRPWFRGDATAAWGMRTEVQNQTREVSTFWLTETLRLLKMTQLATVHACVQVEMVLPMEDWVDKHGRMVIIGEAAHPLPVCYQSEWDDTLH